MEAIIRLEIKATENQGISVFQKLVVVMVVCVLIFDVDLADKLKLAPTDEDMNATSVLDIDVGLIDANGSKKQTFYAFILSWPRCRILWTII